MDGLVPWAICIRTETTILHFRHLLERHQLGTPNQPTKG